MIVTNLGPNMATILQKESMVNNETLDLIAIHTLTSILI